MIIQSLAALYERLAARPDPDKRLPEPGWQENEIAFRINLDLEGRPVGVLSLRQPQPKGPPRAPPNLVPQEVKRTGKIPDAATEADSGKASLFWDNPKYALGIPDNPKPGDPPDKIAKYPRQAEVCHELFRFRHELFAQQYAAQVGNDPGMLALLRFLRNGALTALAAFDPSCLEEIRTSGGNIAFALEGDVGLMCRRPSIRAAISELALTEADDVPQGQCLVTGRLAPIKRIHQPIKGVIGAQTFGANIVSFNAPSFESYGLRQGANAPVSALATFQYTTALNKLLERDSPNKVRAGTTTVAFWAGQATPNEEPACMLMAAVADDNPWRSGTTLESLYAAPRVGVPPLLSDETPFFTLGLSAESKSRLTVRFFHQGTVASAGQAIKTWFDQLAICPEDGPPLSIARLLRGLAVKGDLDNAPPLLASELLHSAYTETPLPQRALAEALVRCSAEQGPTRERAALVKAFLIRNLAKEIPVSLDPEAPDPPYRLGRLFAVLENLQKVAVNPKKTIRDGYWAGASTTPSAVFPQLLDLGMNHLGKIKQDKPGLAFWFEERIGEIASGLPLSLPPLLTFEQQGQFAVGYWHQRYAPKPYKVAAEETESLAESGEPA